MRLFVLGSLILPGSPFKLILSPGRPGIKFVHEVLETNAGKVFVRRLMNLGLCLLQTNIWVTLKSSQVISQPFDLIRWTNRHDGTMSASQTETGSSRLQDFYSSHTYNSSDFFFLLQLLIVLIKRQKLWSTITKISRICQINPWKIY